MWEYKYLVVHDLRRVARWQAFEGYPLIQENFIVRPTIQRVRDTLLPLLHRLRNGEQVRLAPDIETSRRHLVCIGIARSRSDAICIPLMAKGVADGSYWTREEEQEVVLLLREVLTHSNARCIGQKLAVRLPIHCRVLGICGKLFPRHNE